jgi:hypothetical protein
MASIRFSISWTGQHGGVGTSFVLSSVTIEGAGAFIHFLIYGCSTKNVDLQTILRDYESVVPAQPTAAAGSSGGNSGSAQRAKQVPVS